MEQSGKSREPATKSKPRRGGLGRGLGSLIPTAPISHMDTVAAGSDSEPDGLQEVAIDSIQANPWQPRLHMNQSQLHDLAESIRTHGLMQPLVVSGRDEAGQYTLIAGERRWRASRLAGLETVPVVVMTASPQQMLELAIVENVVRADLSPLEEAHAYRRLIEDFGLTQADVAERVGKSRVAVTNTLRLLGSPEQVQQAIVDGEITEGHARAMLGLASLADQLALLHEVRSKNLNVRQTESMVRSWSKRTAPSQKQESSDDPEFHRIEGQLRDALGTRVTIGRGAGESGRIVIDFSSNEHLHAILSHIVKEELW